MATAARPAFALRMEITVGMSAPPIGRMRRTPKSRESPMIARKAGPAQGASGDRTTATPSAAASASSARFTTFCPG